MTDESMMVLFSIVAVIIAAAIVFAFGYDTGKSTLVNDLCNKQKYDFCQVDTYKLQENK